jgi:Mrp family chromosome partitioning ATPase
MNIPLLGIVENYAWLTCPDCGKKIEVFGKSHVAEMAEKYDLPVLASLPIDPMVAGFMDAGEAESIDVGDLEDAVNLLAR